MAKPRQLPLVMVSVVTLVAGGSIMMLSMSDCSFRQAKMVQVVNKVNMTARMVVTILDA